MFADLIEKLRRRQDLTEAEAAAAMAEIMEGRAAPAQIAGMLIGLSMKGERPEEVVGFARTMRSCAIQLSQTFDDVFDTCGTGGDRLQTFNVSSLAALVVAASGVRVAKHGNRSVSSTCGSADLFEALGVTIASPPATVEACLRDTDMAFFFAPTFHPAMRHAAEARRDLGVRTVFNLLGPLTNPAGARSQIVGVPRPEHTDLLARALGRLGSRRAWVVHGAEGLDEISTTGYTKVAEWRQDTVRTFYIHPSDFGVNVATLDALRVTSREESIAVAREVLAGADGPARDFVVVNAAAGLYVSERVASLSEGVDLASTVLEEGRAAETLDALARATTQDPV
jgi:anthranilate phosphoribosyltransferase